MITIHNKKLVLSAIIGAGLLAIAFATFSPVLAETVRSKLSDPRDYGFGECKADHKGLYRQERINIIF